MIYVLLVVAAMLLSTVLVIWLASRAPLLDDEGDDSGRINFGDDDDNDNDASAPSGSQSSADAKRAEGAAQTEG